MFRKSLQHILFVCFVTLFTVTMAQAGWLDVAKDVAKETVKTDSGSSPSSSAVDALSNSEVISGLKAALDKAVKSAIASLGQPGGYLNNLDVKIPMPDNLQTAEKAARAVGQGALADEFIASMNSAAEQAVPETISIFTEAIKNMSFDDAKNILNGPDNAATSFFQQNSSAALFDRILPIVEKATNTVGVTSNYKSMMSSVSMLSNAAGMQTADLDSFVTNKAIDGLFSMMAVEEKAIRDNPVERSTDILKKVFGALD
ncbi:MAG: DUF4197 domain-containing protein [Proteobacteria bacterium]|nr:DUF4197 domain-containing protein [Pseudomonadota bacterium]MBU1610614.1 DUF4197 domain-containing protein [Pseudomonadota bacterium]